jgi:hypothetical protein
MQSQESNILNSSSEEECNDLATFLDSNIEKINLFSYSLEICEHVTKKHFSERVETELYKIHARTNVVSVFDMTRGDRIYLLQLT